MREDGEEREIEVVLCGWVVPNFERDGVRGAPSDFGPAKRRTLISSPIALPPPSTCKDGYRTYIFGNLSPTANFNRWSQVRPPPIEIPRILTAKVSRPPTVTVHPTALLSILDHYLRSASDSTNQRVIGTLLGTRNESNEIEVRNSFAALHNETEEQIVVDMDYHRSVYDLYQKANPKEVIVGW